MWSWPPTARDFPHSGGNGREIKHGRAWAVAPALPGGAESWEFGSRAGMLFIFFWLGGPGNMLSFPVREGLLNSEFNLS